MRRACWRSSTRRPRAATSTSPPAGCRRRARASTRSARPATRPTPRVGLLTRVDDPALLHYRSGGFYAARAARHAASARSGDRRRPRRAARADRGGRRPDLGRPAQGVRPPGAARGPADLDDRLPPAARRRPGVRARQPRRPRRPRRAWPDDAIVVCSLGDASVNHSTAQGALNAAAYLTHRGLDVPAPRRLRGQRPRHQHPHARRAGWRPPLSGRPGIRYVAAPVAATRPAAAPMSARPSTRCARPAARRVLHLRHGAVPRPRGLGRRARLPHAAPRSPPTSRTTRCWPRPRAPRRAAARWRPAGVLDRYEAISGAGDGRGAKSVIGERRLSDRAAVMRPLAHRAVAAASPERPRRCPLPRAARAGRSPSPSHSTPPSPRCCRRGRMLWCSARTSAVKGGVYGVTRGLRKRFGGRRVFDTLLDEQTILGTALGASLAGLLPIPEIQYLAYLHNAEDQLRGEAASLAFFSDGQYRNPMVVRDRRAGLPEGVRRPLPQRQLPRRAARHPGPGAVRAQPSRRRAAHCCASASSSPSATAGSACSSSRSRSTTRATCTSPATASGPRRTPSTARAERPAGCTATAGDLLLVTFGNGVPMSPARGPRPGAGRRARHACSTCAGSRRSRSTDGRRHRPGFDRVLVVDETRRVRRCRRGGRGRPGRARVRRRGWRGSRAPTPTCRSGRRPRTSCSASRRSSPRPARCCGRRPQMAVDLPASASVVVIGGGVMGLSTAYHLAAAGVDDVLLLERTTSAPARRARRRAGCARSSPTRSTSQLGLRSLRTFERFADELRAGDRPAPGRLPLPARPARARRGVRARTSRCRTSSASRAG